MPIKIERSSKQLSAHSGLIIFGELFDRVMVEGLLRPCVPQLKSGSSKNFNKLRQLVLAFQAGAECLDDIEQLGRDEGFRALCRDKVYTAKSLGDFLRRFSQLHYRDLNNQLIDLSYQLRRELFGKSKSITIDIDSTTNRQHGSKMEGVCYNYAGIKGLDTIHAFDEYGLQYYSDVRPGNTHTSAGSLEIIHQIFNRMPSEMSGLTRYVRADSGYCKIAFLNACAAKGAQFVVCMRKLMYQPLIGLVSNWQSQDLEDPDRLIFADGRECEVGEVVYRSKNSPFPMRALIMRSLKPGRENQLVKGEQDYHYRAWISNMSEAKTAIEVIKFYRGRGHAENFIRELKNGLDLHH
ncbi:MAG: IS1380 family transposase [Oligoflexus sp.]